MLDFVDFLHLAAQLRSHRVDIDTGPWKVVLSAAPAEVWPREVELEDVGGSRTVRELRRIFALWQRHGARRIHYRESEAGIRLEIRTRFGWNWWKADPTALHRFVLAPFDLYHNALPVRRVFPIPSRYHEILCLTRDREVGLAIRHRRGFRGRKEGRGYRIDFRHGGRQNRHCWRYYLDSEGELVEPSSLFECRCRAYFQVALDPLDRASRVHLYQDGGWRNTLSAKFPHQVEAFFSLEGESFGGQATLDRWWSYLGPLVG